MTILFLVVVHPVFAAEGQSSSLYDRVVKTKVLRCAYTLYPGFVDRDPNTGEMSGLSYDLVNAIGSQLGIKVEWTDEVGVDVIFEGFKNQRYDMACSGYNLTPSRAWAADATMPIFYTPSYLYVRAGEARFKSEDDLDSPNVSVAAMDGEATSLVATERFPKARVESLMGMAPATDRFEMVASGKADFTPMEASIGNDYMAKNPGKIMQFGAHPIITMPSVIYVPQNERQLKALLDVGIQSAQSSGAMERIVRKYAKHSGDILLPAVPYQLRDLAN